MHDAKPAFLRAAAVRPDVALPQVALGQAAAVTVTADTALPAYGGRRRGLPLAARQRCAPACGAR
jgi:hypothetical protein